MRSMKEKDALKTLAHESLFASALQQEVRKLTEQLERKRHELVVTVRGNNEATIHMLIESLNWEACFMRNKLKKKIGWTGSKAWSCSPMQLFQNLSMHSNKL